MHLDKWRTASARLASAVGSAPACSADSPAAAASHMHRASSSPRMRCPPPSAQSSSRRSCRMCVQERWIGFQ